MEDPLKIYNEVVNIATEFGDLDLLQISDDRKMTPEEEADWLRSLGIDDETLEEIGHLGYHRKNHIPRFDQINR